MAKRVSINYYGNDDYLVKFKCNITFADFIKWYKLQRMLGFDVETNVTEIMAERKLILLQFADVQGTTAYMLQFSFLTPEEQKELFALLDNTSRALIIHNATFEYTTLKLYGCTIRNIKDTYLQEKMLNRQDYDNNKPFSLAAVLEARFGIVLDKTCQTLFGDDIITDDKLIYGARDVLTSGKLHLQQDAEIRAEGLRHVQWLENTVVCAFGDMMFEGMVLDVDRWRSNIDKAMPIIEDATIKLKASLGAEDLRPYTTSTKYWEDKEVSAFKVFPPLLTEGKLELNWNSGPQKLSVLQLYFPKLEKAANAELLKFLQLNDPKCPKKAYTAKGVEKILSPNSGAVKDYALTDNTNNPFMIIKLVIRKAFGTLEKLVVKHHKDKLVELGLYHPAGSIMINWNSHQQTKAIFQLIDEDIENSDADTVEAHLLDHELFPAYKAYNNAMSLITKFGESYITKNLNPNGRIYTTFDLIKRTGRVSSKGVNLQQIPKNALPQGRQKDYRRCFKPTMPGWVVKATDYDSQELATIATVCNEHLWIDALASGKDLHSVCAEMIHKDKWKNAAEDDCIFYKLGADNLPQKKKCSCPAHKLLRQNTKKLDFGLAYGLSAMGYARDTGSTVEEGEHTMTEFFSAFTGIDTTLKRFAKFGVDHGYVTTIPPFRRKRWFPAFHTMKTANPKYAKVLKGQIERAAQNTPIQGSSADMVKLAIVFMYRHIYNNKLNDRVKFFVQVHDEVITQCHPNFEKEWGDKQVYFMELAAKFCLKNNLLKSDCSTGEDWGL